MVKTARTHGSGAPNPGVMRSSMFRSNPMRVIARAAMAEVFIPVSPHREISSAPVGVHRNSIGIDIQFACGKRCFGHTAVAWFHNHPYEQGGESEHKHKEFSGMEELRQFEGVSE